jgi:hypothetical protein
MSPLHLADAGMNKKLHSRALGNAGAAVAGVVIGGLVVVIFFFLCIWPILSRYIRQYVARRNGHHQDLDPESGHSSNLENDALTGPHHDRPRRLPSSDSLKISNKRGTHHHHQPSHQSPAHHHNAVSRASTGLDDPSSSAPSKNLSWSSSHDVRALADGEDQQHLHQSSVPTYPATAMVTSGQDSHPDSDERQDERSTAYDGQEPSEPNLNQPYVLKHNNEDYYNTSIPSEAFGMITTPPPPVAVAPTRSRSASLTQQVKHMFQRKGSKGRQASTGTVGSEGQQSRNIHASFDGPPMRQITDEELTYSPISPSSTQPYTTATLAAEAPAHGLAVKTPFASPTPEHRFKASPSPPAHPAPGTVNPMDIMPASTESELWHRTEHQLHVSSYESPPQLPSFMECANTAHDPTTATAMAMAQSPKQPVDDESLPQPMMDTAPSIQTPPQLPMQEERAETEDDVVMVDLPSYGNLSSHLGDNMNSLLHVGSDRRPSNHSELSTPFPGAGSTDASSHNTPSTLLDSPSPASIHSSDFRHSASPQLAQGGPSEKSSVFRCDEPGCHQTFDQPHKLKHHQRYHSKDHKCPYPSCGKGFGTKTHLQRHINDRHEKKKKYHCVIPGCDYSRAGGKAFPRKDNWKRHMTKIHNMDQHHLPEPIEID